MSTTETRYCYRHPDRPTGLSCSECGRPICTDCMTPAAVGLRCPDHAGGARRPGPIGTKRPAIRVPRARGGATTAPITKLLIAINVGVYLVTAVQGAGINSPGGSLYLKMILFGPYVGGQNEWWRLVTAMFLHGFLLHIAFNMLALWWIGAPVEQYLGGTRYVGLYFVSGLAGSAGALLQSPTTPVVGASGAIFGVLGAMLILEYQATGRLTGNAMTWIVINLVISFLPGANISWGGHIGGLVGGILVTLAFARFGRGHAAYGRLGLAGAAGLVLVAAASIAISYWQVRGFA
ncbi:MAG: rhomboid family intramembrane serine protease [Gaiellaceae bacterium]